MLNLFILFFVYISLPTLDQKDPDVLLRKHFEAVGQELWNQINTVAVDGRWVDENYYGRNIKLTFKAPDKIHIQGKYENQTFVEAHNGIIGWIVAPWKNNPKPQQMNPQEHLIIRNSFSLGSPLHAKKDQLTYGGLVDMEGTLYHTFNYEGALTKHTYFIDRDDHHLYFEKIVPKENSTAEILKIYETYRNYNNLALPTAVRFMGNGLDKELVFDEVFLGLGAKDSLFDPPAEK